MSGLQPDRADATILIRCLLYSDNQKFSVRYVTSGLCHFRTHAPQQGTPLPSLFHILVEPVCNYLSNSCAILFEHHHVSIAV
jgi:hypothetical protein